MSRLGIALAVTVALSLSGCSDKDASKPGKEGAGFDDYMTRSKAIEAELSLGKLARSAATYYAEMGALPPGSAPLTPETDCCEGPNHRCAVDPAAWSAEAWQNLDFGMMDPHYYRYQIETSGVGPEAAFTARAIGDLDCDGTTSTFEAVVSDGEARTGYAKPEVRKIRPGE